VIRGGSWNNEPRNVRAAYRNRNAPENRNNNLGFRAARAQRAWWMPSRTEPIALPSRRAGPAPFGSTVGQIFDIARPVLVAECEGPGRDPLVPSSPK
jgi:hypothetical protein